MKARRIRVTREDIREARARLVGENPETSVHTSRECALARAMRREFPEASSCEVYGNAAGMIGAAYVSEPDPHFKGAIRTRVHRAEFSDRVSRAIARFDDGVNIRAFEFVARFTELVA